MGEQVEFDVAGDVVSGYLSRPPGSERAPGVVLIHEAWGLDEVTRRQADRLASMGYLVLAPDLLTRGPRFGCMVSVFRDLRRGSGRAFDDLQAARAFLLDTPACSGQVGVMGMCMGGGFALLLAGRGEYAVAAPFYGVLPQTPDLLRNACPVVASYGGKDASLKGSAAKLEAALTRFGVPNDVVEYPDAGHSFLNDEPNAPRLVAPLMAGAGAGPHPESAQDAWSRVERFFGTHLRG